MTSPVPPTDGGDDREAASHGFEHGEWHAFGKRRAHKDVAVSQNVRDVVAGAEERHVIGDAERLRACLQRFEHRAVADEDDLALGHDAEQRRHRLEQVLRALVANQAADAGDAQTVGALVEGRRVLFDVDAVGDDGELVRVHAGAFRVVGDSVAHGDDGLALGHDHDPSVRS